MMKAETKSKATAQRASAKAKKSFPDKPSAAKVTCEQASKGKAAPAVQAGGQLESDIILKAHEAAKQRLDHVITECLEKGKTAPTQALAEYFDIKGTSDDDIKKIDRLMKNYRKMRKGMDKIDYEVEHETIKPGEPYTVAYVYTLPFVKGVGDVHVVFPAFKLSSEQDRAATLVHEMSHYAVGTDDHAYEWETDKWRRLTQKQKMDNADSYGKFARNC